MKENPGAQKKKELGVRHISPLTKRIKNY